MILRPYRYPLFLWMLIGAHTLSGQTIQPRFGRITTDDGLSSFRVYDILQDKRGFLWFATMDGLDRYDGYRFKTYKHTADDSTSVSDNFITALCEDAGGSIWVGTRDGVLNRYDRVTEKFTKYRHDPLRPGSINGFPISTLYPDKSGNLWIGTLGGGLSRIDSLSLADSITFRHYVHDKSDENSPGGNKIFSMAEDDSGALLIATDNGLNVLRGEQFICYRHDPADHNSLCSDLVISIHRDQEGGFWIATADGLSFLELSSGKFTNYKHDTGDPTTLSNNFTTCIVTEDKRYVWIGTQIGLNKLDRLTGKCIRYFNSPTDPYSLVNDYIIRIKSDLAGNIWIATDRGLSKVVKRTSRFVHYRCDPDLFAPQVVRAIHKDKSGHLWVGVGEGLKRFGRMTGIPTTYRNTPTDPGSIGPGRVQTIVEDASGTLWIGTIGGGLNRFVTETERFERYEWGAKSGNRVMAVCKDSTGIFWIGTSGEGLVRFDPTVRTFQSFVHDDERPQSLSNNTIQAMLLDRQSNLWIGTEGGGLNLLERPDLFSQSGSFVSFKHLSSDTGSLSNDRIYALCEDRRGRIWIATGSGLDMFDRQSQTFKHFLSEENSFSAIIMSIVEDNRGRLWLATIQNGVYRFDPDTRQCINFDVHDGLQSNLFGRASLKTGDGSIFLGGERGFNVFQPDSIRVDSNYTEAVLTEFKVYDKPAQLDSSISVTNLIYLPHDQNYFSFEFSSLNFTAPEKNRYMYKLEGFDNDWTDAGTRTYAPYTNVEPGSYVFKVKGSNNDGVWDHNGSSLRIVITPPYRATWWFRSLLGVVLVAILIALYRYRVAKLLEMERMRMRIASDLHDDLGSNLASIALTSDNIRTGQGLGEREKAQLMEISTTARKTAGALRDVTWAIDPEHDELNSLVLKLRDETAFMHRQCECSITCNPFANRPLRDIEFGRNVILIYKELLHNIARHSQATSVDIVLAVEGQMFIMTISDNGIGFDPDARHTGLGIRSIRTRIARLHGQVRFTRPDKNGTIVEVRAKIP